MVGDKVEHLHPVSNKLVSSTILHLKSTVWPGFHLFYKEGEVFKVYIGNGEKYTVKTFYPKLTHSIKEDKSDPKPIEEFSAPDKQAEPEV